MSWWVVASAACAGLAGALQPRAGGALFERLRMPGPPGRGVDGRPVSDGVPGRRLPARVGERLVRARAAAQTRASLVAVADGLSAELRAGAAPRTALWQAARDQPRFAAVAVAARSPAGDVASALHELATVAGGAAAADLATAWVVCETSGGRLAAPVARLARAWRDEEQVRREVSAQLAGPRATAVLLAALPLVGIAMGASLGADPVDLLRRPSVAVVVLVPGLLLDGVGLLWTARITRRAATW